MNTLGKNKKLNVNYRKLYNYVLENEPIIKDKVISKMELKWKQVNTNLYVSKEHKFLHMLFTMLSKQEAEEFVKDKIMPGEFINYYEKGILISFDERTLFSHGEYGILWTSENI